MLAALQDCPVTFFKPRNIGPDGVNSKKLWYVLLRLFFKPSLVNKNPDLRPALSWEALNLFASSSRARRWDWIEHWATLCTRDRSMEQRAFDLGKAQALDKPEEVPSFLSFSSPAIPLLLLEH